MIGFFLVFFLLIMTFMLREHCRRRELQQRQALAETLHRIPPIIQAEPTDHPSFSHSPSRSEDVVLVLGPGGEVEVGVTHPQDIKPLLPDSADRASFV